MRTFIVLLSLLASFSAHAQKITSIESFSPSGETGSADQVHVRFSDFMFPLGESNHPAPFVSKACDAYGQSRWLNPKEWVFDFKKALPPKTVCEYELKTGLKSQNGSPVIATSAYSFSVIPAVLIRTIPYGHDSPDQMGLQAVDPDQYFILTFNRKISDADIVSRITFKMDGRTDPVGVTILPKETLAKIKEGSRMYINKDPTKRTVVVEPKLKFPETESSLVILQDSYEDKKLYYKIQPYFRAEMNCNRDNAEAPCSPIQSVQVTFNSPVAVEDLAKIKAVPAKGKGDSVGVDMNALKRTSHEERVTFKGIFRAGETYHIEIPKTLKDIQGRSLYNQKSFPLAVKFDSLPAVAKFPGTFGVLESSDPVLPLSIRNIEKEVKVQESNLSDLKSGEHAPDILHWMKRVEMQNERIYNGVIPKLGEDEHAINYESVFEKYSQEVKSKIQHTKIPSERTFNQAEVIGIPLKEKGLHIVELESKVLGKRLMARETPLYASTAVLVTNLGVHFKWAKNGQSLVWVTELSTGNPVADANITIEASDGTLLASGKTSSDGTLTIAKFDTAGKKKKHAAGYNEYDDYGRARLVVIAKKDDDFSFTMDTFNKGIESWRFNLPYANSTTVATHTILARDLLKPGQTVQMKHYYREFHWQGFTVPVNRPNTLMIVHEGSQESWTIPVKFDEQGIATSEWKVPTTAKLGDYSLSLGFDLKDKKKNKKRPSLANAIHAGSFEVQEFRLPVLSVNMKVPDPVTQDLKDPKISIQGTYLSGGPANALPVELHFLREKRMTHSTIVGDNVFSLDEPVKVGIVDKRSKSYDDEGMDERDGSDDQSADDDSGDDAVAKAKPSATPKETLETAKLVKKVNLDAGGSSYVDIPKELLDTNQDGNVMVSMTYTDPDGEIQTNVRQTSVFSRDLYLGLGTDSRSYVDSTKDLKFKFVVGNLQGKGVKGSDVKVTLYESTDYTHRAKLVGGFYGYQTTTEVKKIGDFCKGKTDESGTFPCMASVPETGHFILEATSVDTKGRAITFVHPFSVYGSAGDAEDYSESDRLTLVPVKGEFDVGETAVIDVRSSFKDATALVTLEREGVMEHFITHITGDKPAIKIPMKMEYSPNLVLSVLEVRPRIAEPAPTGTIDLGKPAFKLGLTELKVGIKSHELPLTIRADQKVYQVRAPVKIDIDTKPGAEVALAVVDEALLKLKPNQTIELLKAMMVTQGYGVETSTLQMNLIGKRHYGKKATPFGGGGGKMMTRELLDSLVAWKPRLKAGPDGKIHTEFKLNDSISSFSVMAIGSEGLNFYGTAKTEIAATQDLQILSSVPPTVRENDELPLQFLIRNTTLSAMHVTANLTIGEHAETPVELEVPAQGTQEVKWLTRVPFDAKTLPLLISAVAKEGASDRLKISSSIVEVLPVKVREGYLTQLTKDPTELPLTFPKDAVAGRGGYRVQLQSRLSEVPDSIYRYMAAYPYSCFEQQTSKAISRLDLKSWTELLSKTKTYLDTNSLIKYFPDTRYGSIDLTAFVFNVAATAETLDDRYAIPDTDLFSTILDALAKAANGEILITETWWPEYVSKNERIVAAEALSAYDPITQAMYESLKSIRDKESLSHSLSLLKILDRSPANLAQSMGDRDLYLNEIMSHYTFENTHLNLKDARFWFFGGLDSSPDALRARTLIALIEHDRKDDATKLLRTMMDELKIGAFDSTPANTWGSLALRLYTQKYENEKVSGSAHITVNDISKNVPLTEKKAKAETFVAINEVTPATPKDANPNSASASITMKQSFVGTGKPWSFTLVEAAVPITSPVEHGYSIKKTITPVTTAKTGENTRGDIYDVTLTITSNTDQTWVAVADPIPTGASILSTESENSWIAFQERRMDRMQIYYEYMAKGTSEFKYKIRLNQQGTFSLPPTRLEAMYDPTQYGELPNATMKVNP